MITQAPLVKFQQSCFAVALICLPLLLIFGAIGRYSLASLFYLLALLVYPSLCPLTFRISRTKAVHFGRFIIVVIVYAGLCCICQLSVELFALFEKKTFDTVFKNCSSAFTLLKEIGFQSLEDLPGMTKLRLASLDLMVLCGFGVFALSWFLIRPWQQPSESIYCQILSQFHISTWPLELLSCLLLGFLVPSLLSLPLMLLPVLHLYMYCLNRSRCSYRWIVVVYTDIYICLIYLYQLEIVNGHFAENSIWTRMIGLRRIIKSDCSTNGDISIFPDVPNSNKLLPFLLLALHVFVLLSQRFASILKALSQNQQLVTISPAADAEPSEGQPRTGISGGIAFIAGIVLSSLKKIVQSLEYRSYLLSLICLILWSIVFYSWASYLLLIWAGLLWMLPNSRRMLIWSSPYYTMYCAVLLLVQYVFSWKLTSNELPLRLPKFNVSIEEIICRKLCSEDSELVFTCHSYGSLFLQALMLAFFMLTMKQRYRQRTLTSPALKIHRPSELSNELRLLFMRLTRLCLSVVVKYWITFCHILLLMLPIARPIVPYKFVYLILFFMSFFNFLVSFRSWKTMTALLCRTVIAYSMLLINIIYVCQFSTVYSLFRRVGLDKGLESIGIFHYNSQSEMIIVLLLPLLYMAAFVTHLHFIHKSWLSRLEEPAEPIVLAATNFSQNMDDRESNIMAAGDERTGKALLKRIHDTYSAISVHAWRLLEIHEIKCFTFALVAASVYRVSFVNFVFFCLMLATLHTSASSYERLYALALIWTGCCILGQIIFQMDQIDVGLFSYPCKIHFSNGSSTIVYTESQKWIGLEKSSLVFDLAAPYLILLAVIFLLVAAKYRQTNRRAWLSTTTGQIIVQPTFTSTLFPYDATVCFQTLPDGRQQSSVQYDVVGIEKIDTGICNLLKYLVNFGFYRFGLEFCYAIIVVNAMIRMDIFSTIYVLSMLPILLSSRKRVRNILWSLLIALVALCAVIQYLSILGFPPRLCINYPWSSLNPQNVSARVREWLFLPEYTYPPDRRKILVDYFLLLFLYRQKQVFAEEVLPEYQKAGGSNEELQQDSNLRRDNPTQDFTSVYKSKLDVLKNLVFQHGFTVVTGLLYATATTRVSIFCLIYLVMSFVFFWNGSDLLLKPTGLVIRIWNIPIYFCYSVIFLKTLFQLISCVGTDWFDCWFAQLLSLACVKPGFFNFDVFGDPRCYRTDFVSHFMDCFCFFFLMLQKRIFGSYYFQHVVVDLKTASRLASHGAIILNRLLEEEIQISHEKENAEVEKLKRNIERIQSQQAKLSLSYREANEHFEAIRSADYYMFEITETEDHEIVDSSMQSDLQSPIHSSAVASSKNVDSVDMFGKDLSTIPSGTARSSEFDNFEDATSTPDVTTRTMSKFKTALGFIYRQLHRIHEWVLPILHSAIDYTIQWLDSRSSYLVQIDKELKQERQLIKACLIINEKEWRDEEQSLISDEVKPDEIDAAVARMEECGVRESTYSDPENSRTTRLLRSVYFYAIANSDVVCYFFMILNHLLSASILSLPLPLSVFLWAMLCVPRPPRLYWILVITYTQAIIVIKYMYQFRLNVLNAPSHLDDNDVFYPFRMLGVESAGGSTFDITDLFLLLALFFHKSMQKRMGLWKRSTDEEHLDQVDGRIRRQSRIQRMSVTLKSRLITWAKKHSLLAGFRSQTRIPVRDVYTPMVFCDLASIVVLIFSYSSFGETSVPDVMQSLKENKVPLAFLILLLIQFIIIVIDRALYLRKNVVGKTVFQIIQVVAVHIWLFFVLPMLTKRRFVHNRAAQLWYLLKCLYFGFSAVQIKCRYPTRILGNVFTNSYDYFHLFCFKVMLLIPFVYEIRTMMDWVFTDTCLSLMSWLQAEDIFANIYQLKCWRVAEKNSPTPRGQARDAMWKYCTGGIFVLLIFFIIWFPLLLFSFSPSFFNSNPPTAVSVELKFGVHPPLFSVPVQDSDIKRFNSTDMSEVKAEFINNLAAQTFIKGFTAQDIVKVTIPEDSAVLWSPSPPALYKLIDDLENRGVPLRLLVHIRRKPDESIGSSVSSIITAERSIHLPDACYDQFIKALTRTDDDTVSINVSSLFPRYIHAKARSEPAEITAFQDGGGHYYGNASVTLINSSYWRIVSVNSAAKNSSKQSSPMIITIFNDKISPESISFLTKYGIFGIYTTFVLVVGRLIRGLCQVSTEIMFRELPNVDPVLQLCSDVYLVREKRLFRYEEQLFSQLVFLYRSPETLIKFTRLKAD